MRSIFVFLLIISSSISFAEDEAELKEDDFDTHQDYVNELALRKFENGIATTLKKAFKDQFGHLLMFTNKRKTFLGDSLEAKNCYDCEDYSTLLFPYINYESKTTLGKQELFYTMFAALPSKENDSAFVFSCPKGNVKYKEVSTDELLILNKKIVANELVLTDLPRPIPKVRTPVFLIKNTLDDEYLFSDHATGYGKESERMFSSKNGVLEQLTITKYSFIKETKSYFINAIDNRGKLHIFDIPTKSITNGGNEISTDSRVFINIGTDNISQENLQKMGINTEDYKKVEISKNNPCSILEKESIAQEPIDKKIFDGKRDFKAVEQINSTDTLQKNETSKSSDYGNKDQ
jgi:hypothetical protein